MAKVRRPLQRTLGGPHGGSYFGTAYKERIDLVVSSRPNTLEPGRRTAWYALSPEPEEPSEVCVGGRRREVENPGMEGLLDVLDETEELVRTGRGLGGC